MSIVSAQAVEELHVQYRKWNIKGVMRGEWINFTTCDTIFDARFQRDRQRRLDQECEWRAVRVVVTTATIEI